ncbi:MAG: DUF4358 domain-containing protein [Lachnospiraceae bacterium]
MKKRWMSLLLCLMLLSLAVPTVSAKNVTVKTICNQVKKQMGEDYTPNMTYTKKDLRTKLGLSKDQYTSMMGEGTMFGGHVREFIIIKAKKGKTKEVNRILTDYRKDLVENTLYPAQVLKAQASTVYQNGNYICFIALGLDPMDDSMSEEDLIAHYKSVNKKAISVIKKTLK